MGGTLRQVDRVRTETVGAVNHTRRCDAPQRTVLDRLLRGCGGHLIASAAMAWHTLSEGDPRGWETSRVLNDRRAPVPGAGAGWLHPRPIGLRGLEPIAGSPPRPLSLDPPM